MHRLAMHVNASPLPGIGTGVLCVFSMAISEVFCQCCTMCGLFEDQGYSLSCAARGKELKEYPVPAAHWEKLRVRTQDVLECIKRSDIKAARIASLAREVVNSEQLQVPACLSCVQCAIFLMPPNHHCRYVWCILHFSMCRTAVYGHLPMSILIRAALHPSTCITTHVLHPVWCNPCP